MDGIDYSIFLSIYVCLMLILIFVYFYWRRGKIRVRIKTPLKESSKWIKPEPDGKTVVMRKEKGKIPEWKFTFSNRSIVETEGWFGRTTKTLDIFHEDKKAIDYDYDTPNENLKPNLTMQDIKEFNDAEALKNRGRGVKYPLPSLFWLIMGLSIVNLFLSLMIIRGLRIV